VKPTIRDGKPVTCKHCKRWLRFNFYIQAMRHMNNSQSQACKRIRSHREKA